MVLKENAQLFDGQSAASHEVTVDVSSNGLIIVDEKRHTRRWSFSGLQAASPVRRGDILRLKHGSESNTRLSIKPGALFDHILDRAEHLESGFHAGNAARLSMYIAVGLIALVASGYVLLNFAPQRIAAMMPLEWRNKLADHTERTFIKDAKQCTNTDGKNALIELSGRVISAADEAPDFSVRVFEMPFVNAFALPNGRIVLTGKLIEEADTPEEVAGIIAHELGHTALLHPEASLVRNIGLQLLINLATGGSGGDSLGGLAGLLTILQYSRNAEREADGYAVDLLTRGSIDPKGLRHFFEKLNKKEFKILSGKWEKFADMISTHPGTDERVEYIKPLPEGQAKQVISPEVWKALKKICS